MVEHTVFYKYTHTPHSEEEHEDKTRKKRRLCCHQIIKFHNGVCVVPWVTCGGRWKKTSKGSQGHDHAPRCGSLSFYHLSICPCFMLWLVPGLQKKELNVLAHRNPRSLESARFPQHNAYTFECSISDLAFTREVYHVNKRTAAKKEKNSGSVWLPMVRVDEHKLDAYVCGVLKNTQWAFWAFFFSFFSLASFQMFSVR